MKLFSILQFLFVGFVLSSVCAVAEAQTVKRSGTTVTVTGTSGNDVVTASVTPTNEVVITINGVSSSFQRYQVRLLVVDLRGGADSFDGSTCTFSCEVNGGAGDDSIRGGRLGDILIGGVGRDFVDGGPGDDTIEGGDSRDVLVGGVGRDSINGGSSDDVIIGGVLLSRDVTNLLNTWFDPELDFDGRLLELLGQTPRIFQDAGMDVTKGGAGRDLFFLNEMDAIIVDFDSDVDRLGLF